MTTLIVFLLSLSAFSPAFAQTPQPRAMNVDDWLNLVEPEDVLISPDGSWVFYSKAEHDWDLKRKELASGGYRKEKSYFMVSATGGEPRQFVGKAGGRDFKFSPDGNYLSLKRKADDDGSQIFLMRVDGGEAIQLTKHEGGIDSYEWGPNSEYLYFLAKTRKEKEEKELYEAGYDSIAVDEPPNGQQEGSWNALWKFNLADREESQITQEKLIIRDFKPSPDGRSVAFTARRENRRNQANLSEIYLADLTSLEIRRLTRNEAPEGNLDWSPDASTLAYLAPDTESWELRNEKLYAYDLSSGASRLLTEEFDGNIQRYVWGRDGETLLFGALQRTNSNLFKLNVSDGTFSSLTQREGTLRVLDFSSDRGLAVCSFSDFDTPEDLYVLKVQGAETIQLTDLNPWFREQILTARASVVRWKSSDGLEIEGLLHLPPGYSEANRAPLLLHIHGGPAGVFTNSFRALYHIYAGLGYASLSPNVRGSSGYSDALLRGNMRDIGGGDYRDLMTGVDHLIQIGIADPDRLGVRGWSYGGILGGWTITQTNRFKAASLGAMVSDWTSEYGPGFNHDVKLWYIGETPWTNPEGYRQKSSLSHIANVETPTILFHGIEDRTDTEQQSMMFFTALKDMGKTVRYFKFPREPHGFREPRHIRTLVNEEVRWMQKYVNGIDWEPPLRPEKDNQEAKEDGEEEEN